MLKRTTQHGPKKDLERVNQSLSLPLLFSHQMTWQQKNFCTKSTYEKFTVRKLPRIVPSLLMQNRVSPLTKIAFDQGPNGLLKGKGLIVL